MDVPLHDGWDLYANVFLGDGHEEIGWRGKGRIRQASPLFLAGLPETGELHLVGIARRGRATLVGRQVVPCEQLYRMEPWKLILGPPSNIQLRVLTADGSAVGRAIVAMNPRRIFQPSFGIEQRVFRGEPPFEGVLSRKLMSPTNDRKGDYTLRLYPGFFDEPFLIVSPYGIASLTTSIDDAGPLAVTVDPTNCLLGRVVEIGDESPLVNALVIISCADGSSYRVNTNDNGEYCVRIGPSDVPESLLVDGVDIEIVNPVLGRAEIIRVPKEARREGRGRTPRFPD